MRRMNTEPCPNAAFFVAGRSFGNIPRRPFKVRLNGLIRCAKRRQKEARPAARGTLPFLRLCRPSVALVALLAGLLVMQPPGRAEAKTRRFGKAPVSIRP